MPSSLLHFHIYVRFRNTQLRTYRWLKFFKNVNSSFVCVCVETGTTFNIVRHRLRKIVYSTQITLSKRHHGLEQTITHFLQQLCRLFMVCVLYGFLLDNCHHHTIDFNTTNRKLSNRFQYLIGKHDDLMLRNIRINIQHLTFVPAHWRYWSFVTQTCTLSGSSRLEMVFYTIAKETGGKFSPEVTRQKTIWLKFLNGLHSFA